MSRPRSYSDADLARAVATSRSWRGVLRALGLVATSSSAIRSVRRHAEQLGLDCTHFTGQRRWTDSDLRSAVARASGWDEVVTALCLSDESSKVALRGHAARLGIDVSHLQATPTITTAPPAPTTRSKANLRRSGTLLAAAWFELCGHTVSWPLEPVRYDLLVDLGGIQRVQVKTTTVRAGESWTVWLSTTSRRARKPYAPEEIDFFVVIDGDLQIYLIPAAAVGGLHAITLSAYREYRAAPWLDTVS